MGSEASKEIGDRFAQLESDVDAKQEAVVDTLATKYTEARKGLDERIEALQAENKGLVDKAIGAIKAVINTIRELVAMLTAVLARVAGVIGDIVKAPIKFLGNLIDGVKGGILKFKDNIVDHLRKGLMSWLFGALAEAGIELPDKFDLMGIIKLLASLFGLTWANIRNRIVKQVGEKAMAAIEKGVEIFSVLRTQGVAGLWQMLLDKLGDIKEMILAQVKDFVITKIITAGITWLIGLLNPAAAFIKACKMIYDIVMFFVDNGSRILKFVNTVIDSVADIVKGNVSGVVNKINDVLGQMVPIIIGFLASLVGLGGIGQKIRAIVETLQKPVTKALDFVIKTGLKLAGPIIRGIKGISGKVKAKVAAGKAWVKGKAEKGKEWAKGKLAAGKAALLGLLKKPFSADGKSHTLSVSQSGKILIASDGGLPVEGEHERGAKEAARASNRTDMYPTIEQLTALAKTHEAHFAQVKDQEVASLDRNDPKNKKHFDAIELITTMARALWTVIHYSGKPGEVKEEHPEGIGNIAPHGQQKSPRKGLISEHVLPDKWLSNVFEQVAGLKAFSNRQYQQMTTILIREGAAKRKTNDPMGDNTGLREILTGKKGVGNAGPTLVHRVDLTMNAIKAEHEESGRGEAPLPTRAAVSEAAAIQMGEVVGFVRENSDAVVGTGADFEGSANLATKAEEALATTGKDDAIRGQFRTAMGNLSTWLRTHSAQAPAPTRTQISALHDRLVEQRDLRWPAALAPGAEEKAARREVLTEAVRMVIASGRPVAEVAREFGVKRETLRDWVYRYREEMGG